MSKETILTAHVLVFNNEKVVLVRHEEGAGHVTGLYGIPGGRLNEGEDLKAGAVRELNEESGLNVDEADLKDYPNNQYSADIQRKDGTTRRFTMTVFVTSKFSGELKGNEETTPEWIEISRLNSYNLLPNVAKAVSEGYEFLKKLP